MAFIGELVVQMSSSMHTHTPLQLQDIEQRQYREEQAALRHWDARLGLRTKTLQELRAMAQ